MGHLTELPIKNKQRRKNSIPKLILDLLKRDKPNLVGYVIEVTLEPS
jgi:hypothetical protein